MALPVGPYKHAIWKSRSFTALFSWTSAFEISGPFVPFTMKHEYSMDRPEKKLMKGRHSWKQVN
jgi:hypothetical protein